jgi:hypothetical protein
VGSFLYASQPIANLSATDPLIAESTVSPNDIGLIHKTKKVKFQIDATEKIPLPAIAHVIVKEQLHHYTIIYFVN